MVFPDLNICNGLNPQTPRPTAPTIENTKFPGIQPTQPSNSACNCRKNIFNCTRTALTSAVNLECGQRNEKFSSPTHNEVRGLFHKRIVGGGVAKKHSHPWLVRMAPVRHGQVAESFTFCAGSILNTKFILTAAHCVTNSYEK
jgi:Trypsin